MSTTELISLIRSLHHDEKMRLMAFLVDEIARDEGISLDEEQSAQPESNKTQQNPLQRCSHPISLAAPNPMRADFPKATRRD